VGAVLDTFTNVSPSMSWGTDGVEHGETVIAGQNNNERLTRQMQEFQVGHFRLRSKKGHAHLAPEQAARKLTAR
jgi:hypothetical protein